MNNASYRVGQGAVGIRLGTTGLAIRFTRIFIVITFTGSPPASAGFLLRLLLELEYGGDMLLRNVSWFSPDYMALYTTRQDST
jgi:hypothetical protein